VPSSSWAFYVPISLGIASQFTLVQMPRLFRLTAKSDWILQNESMEDYLESVEGNAGKILE
jgi:hypothetical protein